MAYLYIYVPFLFLSKILIEKYKIPTTGHQCLANKRYSQCGWIVDSFIFHGHGNNRFEDKEKVKSVIS